MTILRAPTRLRGALLPRTVHARKSSGRNHLSKGAAFASVPGTIPQWTPKRVETPLSASGKPYKRKIVVAIDRTDDCLQGLEWLVDHCVREGDHLELLSVVNNDRALPVSVGMTSPNGRAMTVSFDDDVSFSRTKEYGRRLAAEAQADVDMRFKPVAEAAGVDVTTRVATVEGHASAAAIAEAIVNAANASRGDMLVVSSHGGGLKCSYGSVARYCVTHFKRAIVLLPPNMATHADTHASSLTVGINHVKELQDSTCWAIEHLFQDGDTVNVLRSDEANVSGDKKSTGQASIMSGLREQLKRHNIKELTYSLIRPSVDADTSPEQLNEVAAHELMQKAQAKKSRALVMVNYASRGLMQEMMFGTLSMMASREATMPLALVPQGYSVE